MLIILAREFIVSGIRMVAADKGVVIAASCAARRSDHAHHRDRAVHRKGLHPPRDQPEPLTNPLYVLSWLVMVVALALTIISMMDYFAKARHLLGFTTSKERALQREGNAKSESNEETARRIIESASEKRATIGCAESLTGGLIAGALTAIPGSSQVVHGAIVSDVNDIKHRELGVNAEVLKTEAAVCEAVARQMAEVHARTSMST